MADENTNYAEEKRSLKDNPSDYEDHTELDDSKAKFLNGGRDRIDDDVVIEVPSSQGSDVSFTGLGKEDLMKYADDPFWVWTRRILVGIFAFGWIAMLVAAIIIIVLAPRCPERPNLKWYETDVTYQINPKSFKDSNTKAGQSGAGVGDIEGISMKLSYFENLGVNSLWINSIYKSGGLYDGNDVEDHTKIDEIFGSLDSFKALRKETKKKGMRMVMDFIPNHTGKKHEWFVKSQSGDADYADYYIWADGADNVSPPNNWVTVYNKPAWKYDDTRKQWYYFSYLSEYPDLNLRNEEVLKELDSILRFWLDVGVDGFAVQGLQRMVESNETSKSQSTTDEYTTDQEGNMVLVSRWRALLDTYSDKPGREKALFAHVKSSGNNTAQYSMAGIHIVISDALIDVDTAACDSKCLKMKMEEVTEGKMKSAWMLNTENTPRFSSVVNAKLQRAFQVFHLLLPGSAFVYYGDEIGMTNGLVPSSMEKDPLAKISGQSSRDPFRTPMLWTSQDNAGFCAKNVTPWLPVNSNYISSSVSFNKAHLVKYSPLDSFQDLVKLRNKESFQWGVTTFDVVQDDLFYFTRKAEGFPGYLVVVNRGGMAAAFDGFADQMKLVYDSEGKDQVGQVFDTKSSPIGFNKEGEVYIFEY